MSVGREVVLRSVLDAPPEAVWERVTAIAGVNDELRPWLRMTCPLPDARLDDQDVVPGERLFRSWILLLGLVPIDYDDVTLTGVEPGRGFHEDSRMLSQRRWRHDRTLEPREGGRTAVTDRLRFEPRVPGTARLTRAIVRRTFSHRHRRLRRRFGGRPEPAA